MDSFVLPALVMPGAGGSARQYESDLHSIAGSRRASMASMASMGSYTTPSMFPTPPGSTGGDAIHTTTLTTPRFRSSYQQVTSNPSPVGSLRSPPASASAMLSPALSGHTLVSPLHSPMQRPDKTYSYAQDGRPQMSRFTSSDTAASVMTAQSTGGLAPLTRQAKRESWQSGRTANSRKSAGQLRSSLQTVPDHDGDGDDRGSAAIEKGGVVETFSQAESPLSPPPPLKSYTTFTGFRPYSVHSSYTYVDDGESEVGVPVGGGVSGGMGGVAGKADFMGSDGLPLRPTAAMRRRKLIVRWAWAIGVLCIVAVVVGVAAGLVNAFSAPK